MLSRALLVLQVSISLVLLIGAGLFLRTFQNLRSVDIGFDPQNLVFVRVDAEGSQYTDEQKLRFLQEGMSRLQAVPGVRAVTVSKPTLLSGSVNGTVMYVHGRSYPGGRDSYLAERDDINRVVVAPSYFATMGIPLVTGRGFTERDTRKAPEVAIINEAAARKFFPNENPVGRRFGARPENSGPVEIVGVLRDVRYNSLREQPPPTLYVPYLQTNPEDLVFSVRTALEPASMLSGIRSAVSQIDPNIPIVTVETQMSQLERRFSDEKVFAQAYTLFGSIALFVAAIGLFGLMSYTVARRTREIGIRMAMGAQREEVLSLVLRESMVLVVVGIVIGVAGALGAGRLIESQLFRPRAHRRHHDAFGHRADGRRLRRGGLSAGPARHSRRSDGGAEIRVAFADYEIVSRIRPFSPSACVFIAYCSGAAFAVAADVMRLIRRALKRCGIDLPFSGVICPEQIKTIAIDAEWRAQISVRQTLVFLNPPGVDDLHDACAIAPGTPLEDFRLSSPDSAETGRRKRGRDQSSSTGLLAGASSRTHFTIISTPGPLPDRTLSPLSAASSTVRCGPERSFLKSLRRDPSRPPWCSSGRGGRG